jgi:hypothetical protein
VNPFFVSQFLDNWDGQLSATLVLLASALILPAAYLLRVPWSGSLLVRQTRWFLRRNQFARGIVVTTVTLLFAIVVSFSCGKQGADHNYFFEVDLAAALGSGLFLGWLMQDRKRRAGGNYLLVPLFVTMLFTLHTLRTVEPLFNALREAVKPVPDYSQEMKDFLVGLRGPVYSENMTLLMQAKLDVPAEPAIITCLARRRQWDESGFVKSLADGHFAAIVVTSELSNRERFSPAIAQAIEKRYMAARNIGPFKIYEPRTTQPVQAAVSKN